jgi:hypothetical protein
MRQERFCSIPVTGKKAINALAYSVGSWSTMPGWIRASLIISLWSEDCERKDYDLSYSRENAEIALKFAGAFVEKMGSLIPWL